MNAVGVAEESMVTEERIARIESDVGELKADVKSLQARLMESILATAKEFASLRMEMEKGFGALRVEIQGNRTEIEKIRTEIEKSRTEIEKSRTEGEMNFGALKASVESAKLWMLVTGVGSVILVTFCTFLGRALRLL